MIRRVVIFLALLGAGYLVLHFAVGDEDFAGDQSAVPASVPKGPPPDPVRGGVHVGEGDQEVFVSIGGPMQFAETRDVPDGERILHLPVYRLECLDSEPLQDNLLRMDEVVVQLFDDGEHVADLTAIEALVEIGRDVQGQPSIRQDKDMDLSQVVLRTRPNARTGRLRIETDRARLRITQTAVEMHTPTEQDPVLLLVEGEGGGRLTGKGMQARLPRSRTSGPARIDIEINRTPAIVAADGSFDLTADGRLKYFESTRDGSLLCTVSDSVHLTFSGERLARASLDSGGDTVKVDGDRLSVWGIRSGGSPRGPEDATGDLTLRLVKLEGAPAALRAPGLHVRASNFVLLPGAAGDPQLVTASGSGTVLELRDEPTGDMATFSAERRIHVVRPAARLAPIYRSFGFPDWSLQLLARRDFVRFEGKTTVSSGSGLDMEASRGLLLLRPSNGEGPILMRGYGEVDIAQRDGDVALRAEGNRGFTLWQRDGGETLVLGPEDPDPEHAFTVTRGDLSLRGTGSCRFTRKGEDAVQVDLSSDAPTLGGEFGTEMQLQGATALAATLEDGLLTAFDATGPVLAVAFRRDGEDYHARGRRIVQETVDVFRLEGGAQQPAVVERKRAVESGEELAEWTAPTIRVHRLGERQVLLDAEVGTRERAHLRIRQPRSEGNPTLDLDLAAGYLRLIPYALPPAVVRLHAAHLPAGTGTLFASWLRQPILLARDRVVVNTLDASKGGATVAQGDVFVLAVGARSGYLQGSSPGRPATVTRTEADGRELRAEAPAIRVARAGEAEHLMLLQELPSDDGDVMPPRIFLFDPDPQVDWGSGGPMRLRGTCAGEIAVLPDRVDFRGPVHVQGLLADGAVDPDGPDVRSRVLQMVRDEVTGDVTRIDASGEVELDWYRVRGRAATMTLDLVETLCTVADPDGAEVWMPGVAWMRARYIEANYTTLGVSVWNGRVRDGRPDRSGARRP